MLVRIRFKTYNGFNLTDFFQNVISVSSDETFVYVAYEKEGSIKTKSYEITTIISYDITRG